MQFEQRLRSVERQSRLALAGLAFVTLAWLVSASAGQGAEEVLRARKIELVDAEGRARAELAIDGPKSEGAAVLYLKEKGSLTFHATDGAVIARLPD